MCCVRCCMGSPLQVIIIQTNYITPATHSISIQNSIYMRPGSPFQSLRAVDVGLSEVHIHFGLCEQIDTAISAIAAVWVDINHIYTTACDWWSAEVVSCCYKVIMLRCLLFPEHLNIASHIALTGLPIETAQHGIVFVWWKARLVFIVHTKDSVHSHSVPH